MNIIEKILTLPKDQLYHSTINGDLYFWKMIDPDTVRMSKDPGKTCYYDFNSKGYLKMDNVIVSDEPVLYPLINGKKVQWNQI